MSKKNKKKNKLSSTNKNVKVVEKEVSSVVNEIEKFENDEVSNEILENEEAKIVEKIDDKFEVSDDIEEKTDEIVQNDEVDIKDETDNIIQNTETLAESEVNQENVEEIKNDDTSYTVVSEKKSHKAFFIVSFVLLAIAIILLIFSTVFALVASHKNTIISGIKIKDIDVSNLTKEEATKKVSDAFKQKLEEHITLKHNEYELDIFLGQFDVNFAIDEAIDMAYEKGHSRKYFSK